MYSHQQCNLYLYTPSVPLASVAIILFSALTATLCCRMVQTRTWESTFFVLGGLAQLSGYTARLFSCQDVCNRAAYGVQSVLLLLGPTIFMFSVNSTQTTFARALHAGNLCWVPVALQKWLYLGINIMLIIPQAIGGIVAVSSTSIPVITTASKMTIAIYVVQTVFWGFTFAENIYMSVSLRRHPTEESLHRLRNWKYWNQLFGLSVSIIGFGRNIMRLTMSGGIAFLIENEWPSYAFDGYQMVVIMSAWVVFYLPGKCEHSTFKGDYLGLSSSGRIEDDREAQSIGRSTS